MPGCTHPQSAYLRNIHEYTRYTSYGLCIHRLRMVNDQRLIFRRAILNCVIVRNARPARQRRPELPETIVCNLSILHDGHLPLLLHRRRVGALSPVLLEHNRLPHCSADGIMVLDPRIAPAIVVAPLVRVEVEGAVVEGRDRHVLGEVDTFGAGIRVRAVAAAAQPALVAERDHVRAVEALDVCARGRGPVVDDAAVAAVAARLVAEFPREDGRGGLVAVHHEGDVGLVCFLGGDVGVEGRGVAVEDVAVGVYATEGVPVVEHREDELEPVLSFDVSLWKSGKGDRRGRKHYLNVVLLG